MANFTYFFAAGTTWTVPPNVTAIQVECFGSNSSIFSNSKVTDGSPPQGNYPGASYSKSSNITVTAGATVYFNVGANGGNTWFNTSNATPTSSSSPTSACLAVGTNTAAGSQVAANCGDVKYAGGNGRVTTGFTLTAQGGKAGPNGPGADVGDPYTNTATLLANGNSYLFCQGGGSNGGSQGSLGVQAYGRSGSGSAGRGGLYSGGNLLSTTDTLGSSTYFNNLPLYKDSGYNNYGLLGGAATIIRYDCCGDQYWQLFGGNDRISSPSTNAGDAYNGYIIITITVASQKSVVFPAYSGSFTIPNDFGSLVSIEAVGFGGNTAGNSVSLPAGGGGGGGAAYAKTLGSSVTASMVAGSTVVYFNNSGNDSWLRIGTNSAPSSVTDGVLAKGGVNGSTNTGGAGGSSASSVGDTKYSGGTGGAGYTSSRYNGGGGGGAGGPLGNGATGGAGFNTTANRGAGGGGAANGGAVGSAGLTNAGGAGGTITGGTGGAGATVAGNAGGPGTNGGGGGGSYSISGAYSSSVFSGLLNNSIYPLSGGQGGEVGSNGAGNTTGRPGQGGASVYIDPYYYYTGFNSNGNTTYLYGIGVVVFTYITTNNVTTALTGRSASASSGTLSSAQTLNQTLSGRSADALAGTLTNSQTLTQTLSSAIAEAFGGTFVPSNDQVVNLSSALASASGGTLTNSQLITQALTGASVDGRTSSFPVFLELVGASAAGTTGLFGYINTGWQPINTSGGSSTWTDIDTQQA